MLTLHHKFWPKLPKSLTVPETSIYENVEITARRYPDHEAIYYYGRSITYRQLDEEVNRIAGFLQQKFNVLKGERVLLFMQNSPQFIIAYYAIIRANAVVVPINPMLTTKELEFYIRDAEIKTAIIGQELKMKRLNRCSTTHLLRSFSSQHTRIMLELGLMASCQKK